MTRSGLNQRFPKRPGIASLAYDGIDRADKLNELNARAVKLLGLQLLINPIGKRADIGEAKGPRRAFEFVQAALQLWPITGGKLLLQTIPITG